MVTVAELKSKCKLLGIKGYSKLRKEDLLDRIKQCEPLQSIGKHIFKSTDLVKSIEHDRTLFNLNAIQIFTHGPRSTVKVKHDYVNIKKVSSGLHIYIHSSYPTNPWLNTESSLLHTTDQFTSSHVLGALGVVLHIPKINPVRVTDSVEVLVNKLKSMAILKDQRVILEMKAVKQHPTDSYESPGKINRLIETLQGRGITSSDVCICIDTAHIYAGGANIHTYDDGISFITKLKYPEWIGLLHINGNVYDVRERSGDKHAIPFDHEDKVWKDCHYLKSGCRAFIEFARRYKIDFIVESKEHHTTDQLNSFIRLIS